MALRRTKIVATLGPATDQESVMTAVLAAGVNVVRLNMSHAPQAQQAERIALAQQAAKALGRVVGVLVDLQGPKIRIGTFQEGAITLCKGDRFVLQAQADPQGGDQHQVALDDPDVLADMKEGDVLLLDDGRIALQVLLHEGSRVITQVLQGGPLSDHKGLNKKGGGFSAPALTDKDRDDVRFVAQQPVDYVALSFVKTAQDLIDLRVLLAQEGAGDLKVVAKIETAEAIQNLDSIIAHADAVMVARGDLGVELGYAEVPALQKTIIDRARAHDRVVITATQMMESMIHAPLPTRAEVSDVANAALDGTDAVMLSAESAVGHFPVETVRALDQICLAAENKKNHNLFRKRAQVHFERMDESLAMGAMYLANHMDLQAIVALTESGMTPLWMSRIRSSVPIHAFCRHPSIGRIMSMYRGVQPVVFDLSAHKPWELAGVCVRHLVQQGHLFLGHRVLITQGDVVGVHGAANTLKIMTVEAIHTA